MLCPHEVACLLAGVWLLTTAEHYVMLEDARLCEGFVTHLAGVGLVAAMEPYMLFRTLACVKDLLHCSQL